MIRIALLILSSVFLSSCDDKKITTERSRLTDNMERNPYAQSLSKWNLPHAKELDIWDAESKIIELDSTYRRPLGHPVRDLMRSGGLGGLIYELYCQRQWNANALKKVSAAIDSIKDERFHRIHAELRNKIRHYGNHSDSEIDAFCDIAIASYLAGSQATLFETMLQPLDFDIELTTELSFPLRILLSEYPHAELITDITWPVSLRDLFKALNFHVEYSGRFSGELLPDVTAFDSRNVGGFPTRLIASPSSTEWLLRVNLSLAWEDLRRLSLYKRLDRRSFQLVIYYLNENRLEKIHNLGSSPAEFIASNDDLLSPDRIYTVSPSQEAILGLATMSDFFSEELTHELFHYLYFESEFDEIAIIEEGQASNFAEQWKATWLWTERFYPPGETIFERLEKFASANWDSTTKSIVQLFERNFLMAKLFSESGNEYFSLPLTEFQQEAICIIAKHGFSGQHISDLMRYRDFHSITPILDKKIAYARAWAIFHTNSLLKKAWEKPLAELAKIARDTGQLPKPEHHIFQEISTKVDSVIHALAKNREIVCDEK